MQSETSSGDPSPPRHRNWILLICVVVLLLVGLAWRNRFVFDDAFISFRYARNLAEGRGLVYNVGEHVEGYSNFLWTLLMTLPFLLGFDVVVFSQVVGICFYAGVLALTYFLGARLFQSRGYGLLTVALLGVNYTFSSFATSGLETMMQTFLVLAGIFVYHLYVHGRIADIAAFGMLSLLSVLALLTRLDSGLFFAVLAIFAFGTLRGKRRSFLETLRIASLWVVPVLLIVGAWTAWKYAYYESLLPNTFYVKIASGTSLAIGVYYLLTFSVRYLLLPFLLLYLFLLYACARQHILSLPSPSGEPTRSVLHCGDLSTNPLPRSRPFTFQRLMAMLVVTWSLYIVYLGGDFMEFRLLVPILPLLHLYVVDLIRVFQRHARLQAILIGVVVAGSLMAPLGLADDLFAAPIVYFIAETHERVYLHEASWKRAGEAVGEPFSAGNDVSIAVTAAGAIPYYARLPTVDMHGLTDAWVARHGVFASPYPGHQRLAPISYLTERNVTLLVGHPWIILKNRTKTSYTLDELKLCTWQPACSNQLRLLPADAQMLEIPVSDNHVLLAIYLTPNEAVEEAILRHGWRMRPLIRTAA